MHDSVHSLSLDEFLAEWSVRLHRASRKVWTRGERQRLHAESRHFAERALEARQLREALGKQRPEIVSYIALERLQRDYEYGALSD